MHIENIGALGLLIQCQYTKFCHKVFETVINKTTKLIFLKL